MLWFNMKNFAIHLVCSKLICGIHILEYSILFPIYIMQFFFAFPL